MTPPKTIFSVDSAEFTPFRMKPTSPSCTFRVDAPEFSPSGDFCKKSSKTSGSPPNSASTTAVASPQTTPLVLSRTADPPPTITIEKPAVQDSTLTPDASQEAHNVTNSGHPSFNVPVTSSAPTTPTRNQPLLVAARSLNVENAPSPSVAIAVTQTPTSPKSPGLSPNDRLFKHPLEHRWVMWYDNSQRKEINQQNWGEGLKSLLDFGYVEDFWGMYNNLYPPGALPVGSNYHLFKAGIEPKWEDPANTGGGKWIVNVAKRPDTAALSLDSLWLETILACIGEQFDDGSDMICGAVVSTRKQLDRIALWTKEDRSGVEMIRKIGQTLKSKLGLPASMVISYGTHTDARASNSSYFRLHSNLEL
ncbi:eukaryotic translation initiation factor 4E [Pelomyxa schiedti]|nr:eukaryotic translation initiation factor 4E [Pelomyxa schiedti]